VNEREICGDDRLTPGQRLAYVWLNLQRNLQLHAGLRCESFFAARPINTPGTASPGRVLTEAFLKTRLPELLPLRAIRVLEIGCGSGRLCSQLAGLGYRGSYLGLDIQDRFDRTPIPGFAKRFIAGDAHGFEPGTERFDLIVSVSALEHIPDDGRLIDRLPAMLAPGGLELHFLPGPWGLPVYLWHGYRQYGRRCISERFGTRGTVTTPLGGFASFLLHLLAITVGEAVMRQRIRQRFPEGYARQLDLCLKLDRLLHFCPTMYAVRRGAIAVSK
jgi:SAM-dependent methyltransferase